MPPALAQAGYHYTIYGLRLDSTRPIPGVLPALEESLADVVVSLEGIPSGLAIPDETLPFPSFVSARRDERDEPSLKLWQIDGGKYIRFRYRDNTQFVVDR